MKPYITKEDIPDLASRIPFEQLSEEEQEQILHLFGSPEQYTAMRLAIHQTRMVLQQEMQKVSLPNKAPQALHNALAQKKNVNFLLKPIPLYQAGIGLAASIAILFFAISKPTPNTTIVSVPAPTQEVVHVHNVDRDSLISILADSIRNAFGQEKAQTKIVRYYTYRDSPAFSEPVMPDREQQTDGKVVENPFGGLDNLPNVMSQNKGVSASENDAVERFTYRKVSMR